MNVIDAEYEDADVTGRDLAVRQPISLVPQTTAAELVQRLDVIRGAMTQAMQKDIDYGVIPGTGKKPTLLKPGAEKLAVLFQLDVQLANEKIWHDDGHLTVISRATVFHAPTGTRVASGEGICSTREGRYAFRQSERFCPTCRVAAIIKGKAEYGGGFVCFKKKGGCGAKYADSDRAIIDQPAGQVPNPNIADTYNTVDKMASKRARVDAVLAATGASALFTQDVEDLPGADHHEDDRRFPPSAGEPQADDPMNGASDPTGEPVSQAVAEPASPAVEPPTAAMVKKLNVLVGTLRDAGHITTEQLYQAVGHAQVPGGDGELHWATLRDELTKTEAHDLIDRLSKLEERVSHPSFAEQAAAAIAAREAL